ncbi:MAG: sulfurtransferase TusA family protein [Gammaproteobacteria bacterium]|nr:sulfurtransferase TusA family protein [Gammaproteobacteria bacterium]
MFVDARRLLCPMPVIRLQDAINDASVGDIVEIICTDPGVKNDIPAWCNINNHSLLSINEQDYDIIINVRKENDD